MTWPWARRPPAPAEPEPLSRADADLLPNIGLSLAQWRALSDTQRADYRWRGRTQ